MHLEVDFRHSDFRNEPHGWFTKLRKQTSAAKVKGIDAYLIPRYKECDTLLKHPNVALEEYNSSAFPSTHPMKGYFAMREGLMLFANQPLHAELRTPARASMSARNVKKYSEIIRELSSESVFTLKEALAKGKPIDFVKNISLPFVSKVICKVVGMPEQDHTLLAKMTQQVADGLDPLGPKHSLKQAGIAYKEFQSYMSQQLSQGRWKAQAEAFSDTFLGGIAECPHMLGGFKSTNDLISTTVMLLSAGHLTTNHSLSLSLMTLLEEPEYQPILREKSSAVSPLMVEELFRYHCPAQITRRTVRETIELEDKTLTSGQAIWLALVSANRDETVFKDGQNLDFNRKPNPHLAFGAGDHFCLGTHLARLQLKIFLETLQGEIPGLKISNEGIKHDNNIIFRGLKELSLEA